MNPTRDHRTEAIDSLLYAKAWLDNMFDQAEEDRRNNGTHYGIFFVNYYWPRFRDPINIMIDKIRNMGTPDDFAVLVRMADTAMDMLNEDLMAGEEIAKRYYSFLTDIRLNIKQAEWSMVLANKQEAAEKAEKEKEA